MWIEIVWNFKSTLNSTVEDWGTIKLFNRGQGECKM